jgi:hypothetical protein
MRPARKPQAALHAAVLQFPLRRPLRVDPARLLPSGRSLLVGFALFVVVLGAYGGARATSIFAIRSIEVRGVPPDDAARVRDALAPVEGSSLLSLDQGELERRLATVPTLLRFRYDRAFPNTLRIFAVPEAPVAVLRSGAESWLVSERGRVLARLPRGARPALPRVWVQRAGGLTIGATLADDIGGRGARALALLARAHLPVAARTVRAAPGELTFILRSGLELRLGSERAGALKLAIVGRVLPRLPAGTAYLDVSVPSRPVAGPNSQVED